jgi:hypothetical protein
MRNLRHTFKSKLALSGVDRTIHNAIAGYASCLPMEDLYVHITDENLLEDLVVRLNGPATSSMLQPDSWPWSWQLTTEDFFQKQRR